MKVYVLQAGCIDMEGEDALESIHYSYNTAMSNAKRLAAILVREYEEEGNPGGAYDAEFWYGDEDDAQDSVGRVTLYRGDPIAPDYWWTVREMIVDP